MLAKGVTGKLAWSFIGFGIPILAAAVAIPYLVAELGTARFGILSLVWIVLGYFGFFDMGLGQGLTYLIAKKLGDGGEAEIAGIVRTGIFFIGLFGITGGCILFLISSWMATSVFKIPEDLLNEAISAFHFVALSIPVVILTVGFRSILEAYQKFRLIGLIRAPVGALSYIAPMAILPYSISLPSVVAVLVFSRFIALIIYMVACTKSCPEIAKRERIINLKILRELLQFGGWITLSNISAPVLLYGGRFLLASMVSMEAVAYFSTPYDVLINLLIIPSVFVSVLFPIFSKNFSVKLSAVKHLYSKSMLYLFCIQLVPIGFICIFAKPAIAWWINDSFSENSYFIAKILAVGVFINSFGHISQSVVQSYGRPDLTAKLHVFELIIFCPYLWLLIDKFGIEGAAFAWVLRVLISTVCLAVLAQMCLMGALKKTKRKKELVWVN